MKRAALPAAVCVFALGLSSGRAFAAEESEAESTAATAPSWPKATNAAFQLGEDLFFEVSWSGITGGFSTLSVHGVETVDGRPAYHIVSEARSAGMVDSFYKVNDRNETWLDTESLLSVRFQKRIREGRYRIDEAGVLDQVLHRYASSRYRIDKKEFESKQGELPKNVLDILGSLYFVRTLDLQIGSSHKLDVFNNGKVIPLVVKVKKRESVKVPAGRFDCVLVEPQLREPGIFISKGKKLEVWLTADERRLPVRMRSQVIIGRVTAELVKHQKIPTARL